MSKPPDSNNDTRVIADLLDFSGEMLALTDLQLRYVAVNARYCSLFDKPHDYFIGRTVESVFVINTEHYRTVVGPSLQRALTGEIQHFERWIDFAEKGRLYLELRYHPYRDADGNIAGVAVVGRDRTEAALSLAALQQREQRLEHSETLASRALRAVQSHKNILDLYAIVAISDSAGNITHINDAVEKLSGMRRDEIVGRNLSQLAWNPHIPDFFPQVWKVISGGNVWQGEICARTRSGGQFWVYTTMVPIKDEHGAVEEFVLVSQDITEIKRAADALRRAQKMDAIGQLTGGIAHDFNNLLGIVIGNLELAELLIPPTDPVRVQLENARNAAMRGSVLTRRLLNFSQQTPVQGKAVNLNSVLAGLNVLISKSLTALVEVRMDLHPQLWPVEVDAGDFEDAIVNLALNAGDAMPQGGTLTFATRNHVVSHIEYRQNVEVPPGDYVEIAVDDTGLGMTREVLDRIFEPYFTTKPGDKGTGLGLPMVYGFVKRSQGMIFAESVPAMGSRFTIYLPRTVQPLSVVETDAGDGGKARPAGTNGNETILLVDDEIEIVKVTSQHLNNLGYRVLACTSGEEALRLLQHEPGIDLLFTDVVMPGRFNGVELAEAARELRPRLKVLFTTGYAKVQSRVSAERWSGNLLQKPYRNVELARKLRELLDS